MKRVQLIIAGVVALTGVVTGGIGFAAFISGAAVAAQTGNQSKTTPGVMLVLLGLFLAVSPAGWVMYRFVSDFNERARLARQRMSPAERRRLDNLKLAAMSGAAVGGYVANRVWADRIRDRYDATNAVAGGAGQPEDFGSSPGQPSSGIDPTPAMWAPHSE